ncbi:MAG: AAA family ATPase [Longicatena sp.]
MEVNGKELMTMKGTKESEFFVENMIPIGLTLLGGPPKAGKSLLAIQLAMAITNNVSFLNREVQSGSVLYLALEDTAKSFKERVSQFTLPLNEKLHFIFGYLEKDTTLQEVIHKYKKLHPNLCMVIVDTFAKIRGEVNINYNDEYNEVAKFRDVALKENISLVLVHHIVKYFDKANPMRNFLGSQGLSAATDAMVVLMKESYDSETTTLYLQGKNMREQSVQIKMNDRLEWVVSKNEVVCELDVDVAKVINYVSAHKTFNGTIGELANRLKINIYPNQLSRKLSVFEKTLNDNDIYMKRNRTRNNRTIYLYLNDSDDATMN